MYDHHKKAIEDIINKLKDREEIVGVIAATCGPWTCK